MQRSREPGLATSGPSGRPRLGQAVAPGAQAPRVPRAGGFGVAQPVSGGRVDDDCAGRRLEGGRRFVADAQEDHVGSDVGRLRVRHERGQVTVEARVERDRGVAGQRIRPSATGSSPGCASSRSSVSWPV